jgi:hypothetical protein
MLLCNIIFAVIYDIVKSPVACTDSEGISYKAHTCFSAPTSCKGQTYVLYVFNSMDDDAGRWRYYYGFEYVSITISYDGNLDLLAPVNSVYIVACEPVVYIHSMKGVNLTSGETFVSSEQSLFTAYNMNVSRIQHLGLYYSRYTCHAPLCWALGTVTDVVTQYSNNHCMRIDDKGSLSLSDMDTCVTRSFMHGVSLFTFIVSTFSIVTFLLTHGITFAKYLWNRRKVARAVRMIVTESSLA